MPPSLTLSLKAGHVRAGVALVGRDDDDGTVTTAVRYLKKGGKATVTLTDPTSTSGSRRWLSTPTAASTAARATAATGTTSTTTRR